jgi:regulator of RNase E activity RraA
MPVTVRVVPTTDLSPADIDRWRPVPVAVAVDLGPDIGQIDPAIRPLLPAGRQPRLFGRAVTARCEPPDFGAVLYAMDLLEPGDVLVIGAGGHAHTAMIGEILGGQLHRRGVAGLVCDGAVRDVAALAGWTDLPVYTRHVTPRGPTAGERGAVNVPTVVGGCVVSPGDLILGDDDGLAALTPQAVRARIADAEAKLALEVRWEADLGGGRSVQGTFGLPAPVGPGGSTEPS